SGSARSVVLSVDGTRLAVAYENNVVRLWDLRQGGEVMRRPGRSVAWSIDGRLLAIGSLSGAVQVLDVDAGTGVVSSLDAYAGEISALAWSADGRLASSSWDGTLRVWGVTDGSPILFDAHTGAVNGFAWSPDGERIASVSSDGTARVWRADTRAEIRPVEIGSPLQAVAWSVDGHTVAIGSADGSLGLWDLAHDVGVELGQLAGHRGAVYDLAFSPQGDRLASGSADGTAKVWDIASGREVLRLRGPANQPSALGLSRDGRSLVVGYQDDRVRTWSLGAGGAPARAPETLPPGDGQGLLSVAVNVGPATVVAAGFRDGRVAVWEGGKIRGAPLRHDSSVSLLAFHPGGKKLASGTERGLRVWDLESGEVRAQVESSRISALAWGPDGLVTGDRQGEVRLWDPEDAESVLVTKLELPSTEEVREIWGLAFPVTGEVWILLRNRAIYRWNPATGTLAKIRQQLPDALSSLALSGDGRFLAAVKVSERRVRVLRRDDQSFSLAHQLVGGADDRWMACNAERRCWRHDDGTLLLRPGPLGELTSVPPAVGARSSLTLEAPLPARLDVDGDDASFEIEVRNNGPDPIYWLRVRQRTPTPDGAFLRLQSPATLAVLRPGAVAQLECRLSGLTDFEMPQQRTASLELEL
ncbi:MAG: WD40 repeat domain-containing protein, partial [bacterium]|nr:WD40 repeat domain-containing protein [bacterium]